MELNATELHFVKQAVEQVNIKGKDTIFVAEVLIKVSKALEAQAKAEGLIPETGEPAPAPMAPPVQTAPPLSPATGEPMQPVDMAKAMANDESKKTKDKKVSK